MSKKRGNRTADNQPNKDVAAESESIALPMDTDDSKTVNQDHSQPIDNQATGEVTVDEVNTDKASVSDAGAAQPEGSSNVDSPAETVDPEAGESESERVSTVSDASIQAAAMAAATKPSPHLRGGDSSISRASSQDESQGVSSEIAATEPPVTGQVHSWLHWLTLLLALLACLGVVAVVYMDRNIQYYLEHRTYPDSEQRLDARLAELTTKLDGSTGALRDELSQLSEVGETQRQLQTQLTDTRAALEQNSERLQRQLQELQRTSRDDWLLAEVEYLLRLANQRLLTEGDLRGVEALLVNADRIVRDLDNVSLFPVREALALDLAAIRAVSMIDEQGVYLQLAALSQQVMELPILAVGGYQTDPVVTEEIVAELPFSERMLTRVFNSLESFKQYFRLNTSRSEPLQELLTPDEEVYLRQNLRLMMEQSQLALLKRQQGIYDASIEASLAWLRSYFSYNSELAASMVSQLEQLQTLKLNPQLPDISGSLKAVKAFNEDLHNPEEASS